MPRSEDDNKFEKVTRLLKELSKIDAPSNFETELSRTIKQSDQKKEKESWFDKIFFPKLIPSAALAITAIIIFLLLNSQVDEKLKNPQVSPQLYEEKIDKQSEFKQETQRGKTSTTERQKINNIIPEAISDEPKMEEKSSNDVLSPNEISTRGEPTVLDKMETKASAGKSDQKINTAGEQSLKAIRTNEKESKQIEMLKEKIDTTKDSSKYR